MVPRVPTASSSLPTKKGKKTQKDEGKADDSYSNVEFSTQFSVENIAKKLKLMSAGDMRNYTGTLLAAKQKAYPDSNYTMDKIFS